MIVSMGEMFGNFILLKGKFLRAIALLLVLVLPFYVMDKALTGKLPCTRKDLIFFFLQLPLHHAEQVHLH